MAASGPRGGGLRDLGESGGLSADVSIIESSCSGTMREFVGRTGSLGGVLREDRSAQPLEFGRPPSSSGEEEEAVGTDMPVQIKSEVHVLLA
jgi:hypothetical protein